MGVISGKVRAVVVLSSLVLLAWLELIAFLLIVENVALKVANSLVRGLLGVLLLFTWVLLMAVAAEALRRKLARARQR
ncbi:hypothetical protein [Thermofilum pendens]|uniref:Uncharacterized protein n=1 Tax=Thermofilum pendens (strain DSM 2475 / Hrk 5) TaxID=368408 RepID=A1RX90_THEPD|nr:hypothetical protein [Thermofilum pendens]ABL77820.1 hypothetical protein Tpen_0411 [Thermofilum pendens Hrk 5]